MANPILVYAILSLLLFTVASHPIQHKARWGSILVDPDGVREDYTFLARPLSTQLLQTGVKSERREKTPLQAEEGLRPRPQSQEKIPAVQDVLHKTYRNSTDQTVPVDDFDVTYGWFDAPAQEWLQYMIFVTTTWTVWALLSILVWSFTRHHQWEDGSGEDYRDIFARGHFGCCRTPMLCAFSTLCPAISWADTEGLAGLSRTWVAFYGFLLWCLFNSFVNCGCVFGICTSFLLFVYRRKLRKELDFDLHGHSCLGDALFVLACPCCAITQEARVVMAASRQGVLVAKGIV